MKIGACGRKSVVTILAVKDIRTFRGVDRKPEYYKRWKDYPRLVTSGA